ncbi:Transaldolase [Candidatus Methylacidithermus pantelleriae]|uniref:Transaldolase n=2 Tax=Candidatus Methylacidithermus pantelleriae TaxID=2744239 RepID=A0A8J2FRI7_9BACT|nr:Transaldolase [Candidatus Methylacidithermus pantelleriae]
MRGLGRAVSKGLAQKLSQWITDGETASPFTRVEFTSHPLLSALKALGTEHIWADTADFRELSDLVVARNEGGTVWLYRELDGNTTNQPLVAKVIDRYVTSQESELERWAEDLRRWEPTLGSGELAIALYSILNGRLGREIESAWNRPDRPWEVSLELHTGLAGNPSAAKEVARALSRSVPGALVKVAFCPDHPETILVARDLEKEGVRVNFTATFSTRQVVAAALLAAPQRTNIFMGRLSQGLGSELLGEQVVLCTQRGLRRLRQRFGVPTRNIVASMRRWQTFVLAAGCDIYTAPYTVLKDFLAQREVPAEELRSCAEIDYSDRLQYSARVLERVSREKIEELFTVKAEFWEFLESYARTQEYEKLSDGDRLYHRFEEAGFGDFFYAPTESEWQELRKGKLPDWESPWPQRLALDTLYSLLAIGDFANFQEEMDKKLVRGVEKLLAAAS